nr:cytochrome bd-I oxidase subunit CydX [uncultured Amphritea sp.]
MWHFARTPGALMTCSFGYSNAMWLENQMEDSE